MTRDTDADRVPPPVREAAAALTTMIGSPEKVICSTRGQVPQRIDAGVNDGVVNTARQVVGPTLDGTFGALVVADHGDVLGHYDRRDALIDGPAINAGLFHSGAGFGDNEFFALYSRVADTILQGIPSE